MGIEIVAVEVDGQRYTAWKSASIAARFNEAVRSFQLEVAAENGPLALAWTFKAGTKVKIYSNDDLLLTGYVDRYQPRIAATSASVSIGGRSKGADIVDCSAEHPTGRFEKKKPDEIGNEIAKSYEVTIKTDQGLEALDYQLVPGETPFRALEKMVVQQGLTMTAEPDGSILITKAGSKRHAGGIVEGVNLLDGSADHNWSNRHSKYIVKGQRPVGSTAEDLEIEAIAEDTDVTRPRVVIVVEERDTSKDKAKGRAKNRRDRAAGSALKATVQMQGFRDDEGRIWTPGWLVWVESPFLNIAQDMLIEGVTYKQDSGGSIASLQLVDPRAYGGKKGKGNKSSKAWSQDSGPAVSFPKDSLS